MEKEKSSGAFLGRFEAMAKKCIRFIHLRSPEFPKRLKVIPDSPYCLYVKGNLPDPKRPTCGIVGARACSAYGKKETVRFSGSLSKNGIQIISGMAVGIDSVAAKAAIDAGGPSYAVLGGGADVIYPRENTELYYRIITTGGGIISEYPPGTPPMAWQFPQRNRIISGLSDRLLIMEARKRSGTLSTARHALDQGKDVLALPGRVGDPLSEGCNLLIFDGAGILIAPEYLYLMEETCFENTEISGKSEQGLLKYLSCEPRSADDIAKEAGLDIIQVTSELSALEIEGLAEEITKDFYVRTN